MISGEPVLGPSTMESVKRRVVEKTSGGFFPLTATRCANKAEQVPHRTRNAGKKVRFLLLALGHWCNGSITSSNLVDRGSTPRCPAVVPSLHSEAVITPACHAGSRGSTPLGDA